MSHDELESLASLYALGALDGEDLPRFTAHLAECGRCRELVREHEEASTGLALALPPQHPAPEVKQRILARVRTGGVPWGQLVAAAALLIAVMTALLSLPRGEDELARVKRLLGDPSSNVLGVKGTAEAPGAYALVVWNAKEAAIVGRNMPLLPPGRVYEVWAIAGGKPMAVRTYRMDRAGNLLPDSALQLLPPKVDAFAVTVEKELVQVPTPPIRMISN